MKKLHNGKQLLILSCLFFLLLAISFMLMPLGNTANADRGLQEETDPMLIFTGGLFWVSLLAGIISQIAVAGVWKKWCKKNSRNSSHRRVGLLALFQNKPAMVADIALAISLVGFPVTMKLTNGTGYICFVMIAVLVFSFCMHCILNGKIFRDFFMPEQQAQSREKSVKRSKKEEEETK